MHTKAVAIGSNLLNVTPYKEWDWWFLEIKGIAMTLDKYILHSRYCIHQNITLLPYKENSEECTACGNRFLRREKIVKRPGINNTFREAKNFLISNCLLDVSIWVTILWISSLDHQQNYKVIFFNRSTLYSLFSYKDDFKTPLE